MLHDLQNLGIRKGGVLLVHASLRSLGHIENGAEFVVQQLLNAVGQQGTLLMPALSYETVGPQNPLFNVRHTPSCVGALPEYFRKRAGTRRSIHPTHSVCGVGYHAHDLLKDHEKDTTPCGPNSPFHKLPHYTGQILFIGCGLRPNTSMHAIEELSEPPYLFADYTDYKIIDAQRKIMTMRVRNHNFKGWIQRYDRLAHILNHNIGPVLSAECHLIEAADMWPAVHEKLKAEPLFFVDKEQEIA